MKVEAQLYHAQLHPEDVPTPQVTYALFPHTSQMSEASHWQGYSPLPGHFPRSPLMESSQGGHLVTLTPLEAASTLPAAESSSQQTCPSSRLLSPLAGQTGSDDLLGSRDQVEVRGASGLLGETSVKNKGRWTQTDRESLQIAMLV